LHLLRSEVGSDIDSTLRGVASTSRSCGCLGRSAPRR
jgi:hypothetical protein